MTARENKIENLKSRHETWLSNYSTDIPIGDSESSGKGQLAFGPCVYKSSGGGQLPRERLVQSYVNRNRAVALGEVGLSRRKNRTSVASQRGGVSGGFEYTYMAICIWT